MAMKFLQKAKDGGPESSVTGYWLIEIKWLFSIVLLKFEGVSRNAYHTHAFNSISWVLWGLLCEHVLYHAEYNWYNVSLCPVLTYRNTFHQVSSYGTTWVLSFRGPWAKEWYEYVPGDDHITVLTNHRNVLGYVKEI